MDCGLVKGLVGYVRRVEEAEWLWDSTVLGIDFASFWVGWWFFMV